MSLTELRCLSRSSARRPEHWRSALAAFDAQRRATMVFDATSAAADDLLRERAS
jgi:hypothetical protein